MFERQRVSEEESEIQQPDEEKLHRKFISQEMNKAFSLILDQGTKKSKKSTQIKK